MNPNLTLTNLKSTLAKGFGLAKSNNTNSTSDKNATVKTSNLKKILSTKEIIMELKGKKIEFSNPILSLNNIPIIYPHTINVIQGKAGNHKSRLAEIMCSSFLKRDACENELLNFSAGPYNDSTICYVDTERNIRVQFPYALQQIQLNAGYEIEDVPENFEFISLLPITRDERFTVLEEFIKHIRRQYNNHIIIVLDVLTDCLSNFNDPKNSLELIDLMNMYINNHDVTFICVIHENPFSDKARGHIGTEIMNKASTVMQVGYIRDKENNETDLIKVAFLKTRSTRKPEPIFIKYSDDKKTLVYENPKVVSSLLEKKYKKINIMEIADSLSEIIEGDITQTELVKILVGKFNVCQKTIIDRLKEIESKGLAIGKESRNMFLHRTKNGGMVIYSLVEKEAKM